MKVAMNAIRRRQIDENERQSVRSSTSRLRRATALLPSGIGFFARVTHGKRMPNANFVHYFTGKSINLHGTSARKLAPKMRQRSLGLIDAKLLQLAVEASNDGIVVTEQEGDDQIIIYANPAFERLTGYRSEDILYRDCRFLQNDDRVQPGVPLLRRAIDDGQPCRQILRNYRKDGTPFWNELSIAPLDTEPGQLRYFIGIQKDVSGEIEARERIAALEAEVAQLRSRLAALGEH